MADFGQFEAEKTVNGTAPGGVQLNAATLGVVFADSFVGEFERFVVKGTSADDVLAGGAGADFLDGGAGNDTINAAGGNVTVLGGAGNDFVYWQGDAGSDTVDGGEGQDRLMVSNMADTGEAFGPGGLTVDALNASGGFFTPAIITAGLGNDQIAPLLSQSAQAATWIIAVDGQTDSVRFSDIEAVDVQGSDEFDDAILFQNRLLYAGGERGGDADLFFGDFTAETNDLTFRDLNARPGASAGEAFYEIGTQIGQFERFHLRTGAGEDAVSGGLFDDFFDTGAGDDVMTGSLGDAKALGGAGDYRLLGRNGSELLIGGSGVDTVDYRLDGGSFGVEVDLEAGTALDSFGNIDILQKIESATGTDQGDILTGLSGDNTFTGFRGADVLDGAGGFDTLDYSQEDGTNGVLADLAFNQISDTYGDFDAVTNFEKYILTDKADVFDAGAEAVNVAIGGGDDFILGSPEADIIEGGTGANTIKTGGGDDTYIYGNGLDTFDGGAGFDVLNLIGSNVRVNVDVPAQIVFQFASPNKLLNLSNVEQIVGSTFDDGLFGFNDDDILIGWSGNDRILGRNADDTLFGNSGDDILDGGSGNDRLYGGSGNDTGLGGEGDDVYFYSGGSDVVQGESGSDLISFEALDYGIGVVSSAAEVYRLDTLTVIDTPATRDLVVETDSAQLVSYATTEALIATDPRQQHARHRPLCRRYPVGLRGRDRNRRQR